MATVTGTGSQPALTHADVKTQVLGTAPRTAPDTCMQFGSY